MNVSELNAYTKLVERCADYAHENADLKIQIKDLKAELSRLDLLLKHRKEEGEAD